MSIKWHVKKDGDMGICRAQSGNCPLVSEGAVHFSNSEDAANYSQEIFENEHGLFKTQTKEIPNESDFYEPVSSYDYLGDVVSKGDYLKYKGSVYEVNEVARSGSYDTNVSVTDPYSGESRTLYLDEYNQSEVLLKGDGPLDKSDVNSYDVSWDQSSYLGSYIDSGDKFAYEGNVYTAENWEWNRALLHTEIEATNEETGEEEVITIYQGSEPDVTFLKGTRYKN